MKTIQALKIAAMLPLGLLAVIFLIFAVAESVGGDFSGLAHLLPVFLVGLVIAFCWKRPLWGGILLLAGAAFEMINFGLVFGRVPDATPSPLVILIPLLVFSGLSLLLAEWLGRRIHQAPAK